MSLPACLRVLLRSTLLKRLLRRVVGTLVAGMALCGAATAQENQAQKPVAADNVAVTAARERAKLLHDVYSSTLDAMHHRYFRPEGRVLPARAMEDVFEEMEATTGDKANWIAVNTKAMSIDHKPKTDFEKQAAAELSTGKDSFERITDGMYQRAAPIPLRMSCVGCHTGMSAGVPKTPRFAGLVISIALKAKTQ